MKPVIMPPAASVLALGHVPGKAISLLNAPEFAARLSDLESNGFSNAPLQAGVSVMNGARIRIDLGSGETGVPILAMAGSAPLTLERGTDGSWSASGRFIDSSNPPNPHPAIVVTFLRAGARVDERYPISLAHQ